VKGFTLIELLIVIGVIGILVTGVFVYVDPLAQLQKAHDARRKSDLAQIQRALEQFYKDDNGKYPANPVDGDYRIQGLDGQVADWGAPFLPYMAVLPKDSKDGKKYIYISGNNGQSYRLYASLERGGSDPQACKPDGSICSGVPSGVRCGTAADICNYGVSSPNVSP